MKTLQNSDYTMCIMVSRQSLHSKTSCPLADRCSICGFYFWWFRQDSLHIMPQASSTIRYDIEIFRVMLSNLMCSLSVWCSAELFDVKLRHLCVRCTIWHNAEPFQATLHRFRVHRTIWHYAELFHATLHRLCAILQMNAKLFAIELLHFTISCSNST